VTGFDPSSFLLATMASLSALFAEAVIYAHLLDSSRIIVGPIRLCMSEHTIALGEYLVTSGSRSNTIRNSHQKTTTIILLAVTDNITVKVK
jgi:hypothetical protein